MQQEDMDDSCDIQHIGRETVVKASDDGNNSLPPGKDYLPLAFDRDYEIIPNNAKAINT